VKRSLTAKAERKHKDSVERTTEEGRRSVPRDVVKKELLSTLQCSQYCTVAVWEREKRREQRAPHREERETAEKNFSKYKGT
jgi:hypothetical protein